MNKRSHILFGMIATLCLAAVAMGSTMIQAQANKPTFFIFLVRAANPPKATEAEITEYQNAHIGNFKRLFQEGKLLTAGPMSDPTQSKRGIVILSVPKMEDIAEAFVPDPYVSKGFMNVQAFPVKVEFGKINTEGIDPNGIVENRIVIFSKGQLIPDSPELTYARKLHLEHIKTDGPAVGLAFFANLTNSPDLRAVALFKGKDDAAIQAWIDADPLIKNGTMKAVKMPQFLGKGVLGD
jgi:uncharacterized protein YciI